MKVKKEESRTAKLFPPGNLLWRREGLKGQGCLKEGQPTLPLRRLAIKALEQPLMEEPMIMWKEVSSSNHLLDDALSLLVSSDNVHSEDNAEPSDQMENRPILTPLHHLSRNGCQHRHYSGCLTEYCKAIQLTQA